HRLTFSMEGVETYSVEGTPGDAVILGLSHIMKDTPVDLVVSGVNHGHNIGTELLLSGTVGAALHARMRGLPAIAVSAAYQTPYRGGGLFEIGAKTAVAVGRMIFEQSIPSGILYNVNVPFTPPAKLKGVYLAKSSYGNYADDVREEDDGRGRLLYHLIFQRTEMDTRRGTEAWALARNYIAITLLNRLLSPLPNKLVPPDFAKRIAEEVIERKTARFIPTNTP
ncbi:MAG: hypothetical protein EXR50_06775, partial [Dehalococcoidia bacterium]|nr:hypothetical protein [Dehalococcoidia bacterium]